MSYNFFVLKMVLSRTKWQAAMNNVVTLCSFANFINSADRVIMPIAIIKMSKEFEWSMHDQGWVLSSFSIGYLGSMILGAAIARKYGGKRILTLAVSLWSVSTLFTPFVANDFTLLILTRILLGVGEGLGMPTIFHIFSSAVNQRERSTAFGYLLAAGSIGQTAATLLCPYSDWPTGFYVFGSLGVIWTVLWCVLYRDSPLTTSVSRTALNVTSESEDANDSLIVSPGIALSSNADRFAQAAGIGVGVNMSGSGRVGAAAASSPSRVVLPAVDDVLLRPLAARGVVTRFCTRYFTKSGLWAIYVAHFSMNWSNYIVMQWFPTYLSKFLQAHYSQITFTCLPYIMNSIGSICKSCGSFTMAFFIKTASRVAYLFRCPQFLIQQDFMDSTKNYLVFYGSFEKTLIRSRNTIIWYKFSGKIVDSEIHNFSKFNHFHYHKTAPAFP